MTSKNLVQGNTGLWEVVIGLEVHAQVSSKAKLFSGASTAFGADPNSQVNFLDAGMPGMLPVVNSYCVDQAIKTGMGFNAEIMKVSVFDRKNYFYPDLPQGYQISQFHHPIVLGGYIDIELEDEIKRIRVTRLHLEQDAGKSIHDLSPTNTYIDLNRAGIALMEIVSEPDMRSATEAMAYVKKLRSILRYIGSCDGNMEEGSLRVDANVSVRRPGEALGNRAEIKNVNSVRFLGQAIEYEISRQIQILEEGGAVLQETRLFDPNKLETRSMRSKEDAHDYRYFPDPDLAPLILTDERIEKLRQEMPELPDAKKQRLITEYGITDYDASVIVAEQETAAVYEKMVAASTSEDIKQAAKLLANWLISEVFGALNRENKSLADLPFPPEYMAELIDLIVDDTLSGKMAKDIFSKMWETGKKPRELVEELGVRQISDADVIKNAVEKVIEENPNQFKQLCEGKTQLFGFFVGKTLQATQGKANPKVVNEVIERKVKENS